jgi:hypothetical protein
MSRALRITQRYVTPLEYTCSTVRHTIWHECTFTLYILTSFLDNTLLAPRHIPGVHRLPFEYIRSFRSPLFWDAAPRHWVTVARRFDTASWPRVQGSECPILHRTFRPFKGHASTFQTDGGLNCTDAKAYELNS